MVLDIHPLFCAKLPRVNSDLGINYGLSIALEPREHFLLSKYSSIEKILNPNSDKLEFNNLLNYTNMPIQMIEEIKTKIKL
jgi:hypothetical protein